MVKKLRFLAVFTYRVSLAALSSVFPGTYGTTFILVSENYSAWYNQACKPHDPAAIIF